MHSIKHKGISLFLVFFLLICMAGASNDNLSYAKSKKIQLWYKTMTMTVGETEYQVLFNKNDKEISPRKIKWKSSNPSVAKINKKGKVSALRIGTAKMTAKYKGKTYKFKVIVKSPFNPGEMPRNFKINDYYKTLGYYLLTWDGLIAADSHQIFISINGEPYKLYATTSNFYYYVKDLEDGSYSFKIRGVCGDYYSSFTGERKVEIKSDKPCTVSYLESLPLHLSNGQLQLEIDNVNITTEISTWSVSPRQYISITATGAFSGISYHYFWDSVNINAYLYDENNKLIYSGKLNHGSVNYDNTFQLVSGIYLPLSNNGHYRLVIE